MPAEPREDIPLHVLFERNRVDHQADHDRERAVARETAQRLEREVEETAARLEAGVQTALTAVAQTARIHAEAHAREHAAHERIHSVEQDQLDKTEVVRHREGAVLAEQLREFKTTSNEWRGALADRDRLLWSRKEGELLAKQVDELLSWRNTVAGIDQGLQSGKDASRASRTDFYAGIAALGGLVVVVNVILALVR